MQVLLPLFCYCQLDNFAWGTRGIDAAGAAGEGTQEVAEKKAYEVCHITACDQGVAHVLCLVHLMCPALYNMQHVACVML